ncbi:MAG: hypothetical protein LCH41_12235 [Armatimonadetes bacterium]|nr:hypothetical protein [Armatimonadota bacterium]
MKIYQVVTVATVVFFGGCQSGSPEMKARPVGEIKRRVMMGYAGNFAMGKFEVVDLGSRRGIWLGTLESGTSFDSFIHSVIPSGYALKTDVSYLGKDIRTLAGSSVIAVLQGSDGKEQILLRKSDLEATIVEGQATPPE